MDKDRIEGTVKEGAGKAKEAWGDMTNDTSTQVSGERDQAEGKLQQEWGKTKDTARDVMDNDGDADDNV